MKTIKSLDLSTVTGGQQSQATRVQNNFNYQKCMVDSQNAYGTASQKNIADFKAGTISQDQFVTNGLAAGDTFRAANRVCDQLPE